MAKQSGLHQIRGKVGEHSYYRQSGVASGLIRSINQGLSSRVKTGDEYANTRLNNAEFGAACNVASLLGRMVSPKYRPMILPFSQSKMSRAILELARQNNNPWGQRVVDSNDTPEIAKILTATSKLNIADFATIDVTRASASMATIDVSMSVEQVNAMVSQGISGVRVNVSGFMLRTGEYINPEIGISKSIMLADGFETDDSTIEEGSSTGFSTDITVASIVPTVVGPNPHRLVVVVLMPFRTVGGLDYTLQEKCSFVCVPLPGYVP